MKKLFVVLVVLMSGFVNSQELENLNSDCDSNYIVDYRMIYSDSVSETLKIVEETLYHRFNLELHYFMGDFDVPNDLVIGILHPNYPEYVIYGKLCNLEKLFQTTSHLAFIESYFKVEKERD